MAKIYGLILTICAGLFFIIGGLLTLKVQNKAKLEIFSCALSFVIMLGLIFFDLAPELKELFLNFNFKVKILLPLIFIPLGFLTLKILDIFIPDHHHNHHSQNDNKKEHLSHLEHIGLITLISLIIHNILEGSAIFGLAITDLKLGLLVALSVALHNIPLGAHIFSSLDIKENKLALFFLTISSLTGGLIFLSFGSISNLLFGIITSITIGMLLYITFMELLPELIPNLKTKTALIGILIGFLIETLALFL